VSDTGGLFRDAMSALCSGVAVVTARREDGAACGLVATSVS
jgi:flavin reductase (DIM6/NTAB) family NADH-FMN oxidoreductase RutF